MTAGRAKPNPDPTAGVLVRSAPVTPSPGLLNPRHQRFAQEYAVDLNATQAYMRAYPGCTDPESAAASARRLLQDPQICSEIQRVLDERAQVTGITADRALIRVWEMATANARELVDVVVGSCRHCWGLYHEEQYTEGEWSRMCDEAISAGEPMPPEKGGTGFNPNRPPNPECPECFGDGVPRSVIKNLADASPGAQALFRGVKYDKQGNMMLVIESSAPHLRMVMEHLGLLNDKLPGPATANPLQALLEEIRGRHGNAAALPIVHQDPEQRPQQAEDAIDVDAREITTGRPKPAPVKPHDSPWRRSK